MKLQIKSNNILERNPGQLSSEIDGEIVFLSIKNSEYYSLDSVGTDIWKILEEPCTLHNLISSLVKAYNISEEACMKDTLPFLKELIEKNIILCK